MNPADLDLARRLATVPGIWRDGSQSMWMQHPKHGGNTIRFRATTGRPHADPWFQPERGHWELIGPDFDDGPTRGALLDVAREALAMPCLCILCTVDGLWYPYAMGEAGNMENDRLRSIKATTEGAALALTILSALEKT